MAEIEYFYSLRSSFAYLGAPRLIALARRYGRRIRHRPILLRIVVPETGGIPFEQRHPARLRQAWDDLQRWARAVEMPIQAQDPVHHYGPLELPSGLVIAAQRRTPGLDPRAVDRLGFEILAALWRDDSDIADPEVLDGLCAGLGLDGAALRAEALAPEVQDELLANSREAVARGVIGAPTYGVDGTLFFGQDRLDFVERALRGERV